ncbi:J domain-containing protein [Limisalsivibrio acetivorans]|uniref:J domain-containing protein n=1 Tax=Limisalsivibrio acetivorans TaxID=1304888 RepID=UPI0003B448F0|nr:J domain-containing protein [Limisalsivibrio acetivorans]
MMNNAELISCLSKLYGTRVSSPSPELLNSDSVKKQFRRMAMKLHPDMNRGADEETSRRLGDSFISVNEAYKNLLGYLESSGAFTAPSSVFRQRSTEKPQYSSPGNSSGSQQRAHTSRRKRDFIPSRKLSFEEYLYYTGIITWHDFIAAKIWIRAGRSRLGEIAIKWGWITRRDLEAVLPEKRFGEQVGELMVRSGLITRFRLNVLLRLQKQMEPDVEEYFLSRGILSESRMMQHLTNMKYYNSCFEEKASCG